MTELDANCDLWLTEIAGSERAAEVAAGTAVDDDTEEYGFLDLPERVLLGVARLQVELFVVVDPRARRGVRHPLISVLTIAILGCICGCDNAEALEDWGRKEARWLRELVPMPHGAPGQDVFLRVFAAIDPVVFRGALVSIDSMCCQVRIASATLAKGGDYLFGLKGNPSSLHDQVKDLFEEVRSTRQRPTDAATPPVCDHTQATDADHGRIEVREAWTCSRFDRWVPAADRWPGLKTLVCVASQRTDRISGQDLRGDHPRHAYLHQQPHADRPRRARGGSPALGR